MGQPTHSGSLKHGISKESQSIDTNNVNINKVGTFTAGRFVFVSVS